MILNRRSQILLAFIMVLSCVVFYFIFEGILPYYFSGGNGLHIIDIHVMCSGFKGLFDYGYIEAVEEAYNAQRYKQTFFLVDLLFLVNYSILFLVLSYVFWNRRWYKWIFLMYIAGMLLDLGENSFFLYYLYHAGNTAATLTAFSTSFKSLIFPLNIGSSLVLFVWGFFVRETPA